ncbi:unnamed protein product, partial [Ectocarpus sp. 12 AP-2014]
PAHAHYCCIETWRRIRRRCLVRTTFAWQHKLSTVSSHRGPAKAVAYQKTRSPLFPRSVVHVCVGTATAVPSIIGSVVATSFSPFISDYLMSPPTPSCRSPNPATATAVMAPAQI